MTLLDNGVVDVKVIVVLSRLSGHYSSTHTLASRS
jgi:hypothetical protein